MRITDCDNIRPHVENDNSIITLYDSRNSDNEYDTLNLVLSKNFMNTHIYVDIKYSKHVHQMTDKLINALDKLNMYFELSKSSTTLPRACLKETEFLIAMKNYIMEHPYIYAYGLTPKDIIDYTIDLYKIARI